MTDIGTKVAQLAQLRQAISTREQWIAIVTGEDFARIEVAPGVVVI